jgi:NAD(P)-dependent dehydrogenase (short-subunit alcohol dehydrogenase family)
MAVLDRFRLDGRRALVTGGSKGLGRAIAIALAQAGADVVIVSRDPDACRRVADEIASATGRSAAAYACDVTDPDQVSVLRESAAPVDVLVNSAGINIRGPIGELTIDDWNKVIDVNLKSPFLMNRAFGPAMVERGWGRLIHLGSLLSHVGIPGRTPYASSKAGLLGLTRVLALEWASRGVTVNALCPGVFATDMNREIMQDPVRYQEFVQKIPMGRWGELDEITAPALFLASDASSYMTGQVLVIDGGWIAQ